MDSAPGICDNALMARRDEASHSIRSTLEQLVELEKNFNRPPPDPSEWFDFANDFNDILESGVAGKGKDFQQQVGKTIDAFLCSILRGIASTDAKQGSIVPSLNLIEKSLRDLGLDGLGGEYAKELQKNYSDLGGMSTPPKALSSD